MENYLFAGMLALIYTVAMLLCPYVVVLVLANFTYRLAAGRYFRWLSWRTMLPFLVLLAGGWACAALTGRAGAWIGLGLVAAILAYDARIKRTAFGPLGMALCRFLNVLLGLSLADRADLPLVTRLHLAVTVGVYIVGVTWFARTEVKRSDPNVLTRAALVMLAAGLLALAVGTRVQPGTSSPLFPYLLVAAGFWVGGPVLAAVRKPTADRVQAGVKRGIFGLVVLDALLASVFVGTWGLLLVLLLPPALILGKWVYST